MAAVRKKLGPLLDNATTIKTEAGEGNQHPFKIKLPSLTIQPFSGKYEEWLAFKDAFKKAVHEQQSIPRVQKFQILRGLLRDDAYKLIVALEATEDNYEEAWGLLENRYENKRLIINTHMRGLFELPAVNKLSLQSLRSLVDASRTHIRSLKSLAQPVDEWDTIIIYLLMTKLDSASKEEWEKEVAQRDQAVQNYAPKFEDLMKFLEKRCHMLETVDRGKQKAEGQQNTTNIYKKEKKISMAITKNADNTDPSKCSFCSEPHRIHICDKFLKLSLEDKHEQTRKLGLCLNCLRKGHQVKECRSSTCRKCNKKHNTLLHKGQDRPDQGASKTDSKISNTQTQTPAQEETSSGGSQQNQFVSHCAPVKGVKVLLSTAQVYIQDEKGRQKECRALIDPGSQINLVTEHLMQKLGIRSNSISVPVSTINKAEINIKKKANLTIHSAVSRYSADLDCCVIPAITESIPQVVINTEEVHVPDEIQLADPSFSTPGPIDILIGAGLFWKVLIPGEIIVRRGQPTLQNKHFGWIVGGELHMRTSKQKPLVCNLATLDLHRQLEKIWRIEEVVERKSQLQEEDYCEGHFKATHFRDEDGRFVVQLLQDKSVPLGESFAQAHRRLLAIERRFAKQPLLQQDYIAFMQDYQAKGHMSLEKQPIVTGQDHYYIPHQPVVREESLTTKLRVVFDASCKTTLQTSLNDRLLPGPNLQNDIVDILLRFRTHAYVITADVSQMFRQVLVAEQDRDLQLILWREHPEQPISSFRLNTVTYFYKD